MCVGANRELQLNSTIFIQKYMPLSTNLAALRVALFPSRSLAPCAVPPLSTRRLAPSFSADA
eukprot:4183403-Pleurochrysis_carterae.AAC.1